MLRYLFRYLVFYTTALLATLLPAAAARAACAALPTAGDGFHAPSLSAAWPHSSWLRAFVPRVSGVFTAFDHSHSRVGLELPLDAPANAGPADHNRHLRTGAWHVFLSWDLAADPADEPASTWFVAVQTGVELHVALHGLCRRLDALGAPDVGPSNDAAEGDGGALEARIARSLEREHLESLVFWYVRWTGGSTPNGARLAEAS